MSSSKIKICIVMPTHWSHAFGGAEYQVSQLVKQLEKNDNIEITFICRNVETSFRAKGYRVIKLDGIVFFKRYSFLFDAKSLLDALNTIRPDVIYQRVACAYTGISALYAKHSNTKLIWHVSHDLDVTPKTLRDNNKNINKHGIIEKAILEYGVKNAASIIVQTSDQARLLKRYYGIEADYTVKNFHPEPKEKCIKGKILTVVWISNFKPIKQPEIFVRLAKDMSKEIKAKFLMMGGISANDPYSDLFREISNIESIEYLGQLPQEKVNDILSKADILVNTSYKEGFSNTFIQAWMREVPVLSLHVDPDNLLRDLELGICAGNYNNLYKAALNLANSPAYRKSMGIKGKEYANINHSLANAKRLAEFLTTSHSTNQPT